MKLIYNDIDLKTWNDLLEHNSYSSPFQTPSFYELCNRVSGYSACVVAVEDDELLALCVIVFIREMGLKGYFTKRAIIFGGPLLKSEAPEVLELLLRGIIKSTRKRSIYTEIRNYNDYNLFRTVYSRKKFLYHPYLNFRLNLENKNSGDILASMQYNRRREIHQTLREEVFYHECSGLEEVRDLYEILTDLYKTRVRLPLPNFDFFEQLYLSGIGKIFVVNHENKVIGGSFCLVLPGNSLYTMYYCGIRNYRPKVFPTHIAIWAAIEYSIATRVRIFDFMGAGKPGLKYGVRDYKEKFGGDLVEYGRFLRINNLLLYKLGKFGLYLYSKLNH